MLWHGICTLYARCTSIRSTRAWGQSVFVARFRRYVDQEIQRAATTAVCADGRPVERTDPRSFDRCTKNRPGENMRTASKTTLTTLGLALAVLGPALAWGADAPAPPVPNKGDTAWMLTSTALVLLMSVPALALFYGGLVRTKNMLSVLMQVFVVFSLIVVLWSVYGYSLAFTEGSGALGPFVGGLDRLFLAGTFTPATGDFSMASTFDKATPLPELVYVAFQATFAAITCCLIFGSTVERIK